MNNLLDVKLTYNQAKELSKIIGYSNTRPFFGSLNGEDVAYLNVLTDLKISSMKNIPNTENQLFFKVPLVEYSKEEVVGKKFAVSFFGPFTPVFDEVITYLNLLNELYTEDFFNTFSFRLLQSMPEKDYDDAISVFSNFYGVIRLEEDYIIIYSTAIPEFKETYNGTGQAFTKREITE